MKGISRWIKSEKLIKKTINTILSSLRSQNYFFKWLAKRFLGSDFYLKISSLTWFIVFFYFLKFQVYEFLKENLKQDEGYIIL